MRLAAFQDTLEQFKAEMIFIAALSLIVILLPVMDAVLFRQGRHNADVAIAMRHRAAGSGRVAAVTTVSSPEGAAPVAPISTAVFVPAGEAVWPIRGRVTADFGRPHWPWQARHTGMDISSGNRAGADVRAFRAGTVEKVIHSGRGLGNHVIINHGEGIVSYYGHLSATAAQEGQQVKAGDKIGREGATGMATGVHLHFEVHRNGTPVNPRDFISGNPA